MAAPFARNDRSTRFPLRASKFFGRDAELQSIRDALARTPIVTIVGFGGVGKTRMALRFGDRRSGDYSDGVVFVECDRYETENSLARAIIGQIEPEASTGDDVPTLVALCRRLNLLVILDGAERYLDNVASVVAAVAAGNPSASLLVTSREPLKITGERVVTLTGLDDATAMALFADRAMHGNMLFSVTDSNRERVAGICRRLDGIALAIELAASWTSVMDLNALETRLSDRYHLLTRGGSRDAPERHQSLKAVVDGSYDTLSDGQQILFRRLAVFASTFSLDAILGVCVDDGGDEWTIVDDLAALVDKSLVVSEQVGDGRQYRLLHTLREYGSSLLREAGEEAALIERLDRWCVVRANDPDVGMLLPNIEDFRSAVVRAIADPERAEAAATLLAMPRGLWFAAGDWHFVSARLRDLVNADNSLGDEARGKLWLVIAAYCSVCRQPTDEETAALEKARALLEGTSDATARIRLLQALARVRMRDGDLDAAHILALKCIDVSREQGDRYQEGIGHRLLAYERFYQRDYEAAEIATRAAIDIFREFKAVAFESSARITLAEIQFASGKPDTAIETIEAVRSGPSPLDHYHLGNLAIYLLAVGRHEEARATARRAIEVCRAINEHVLMLSGILALAASCASTEPAISAQLLGYIDAERLATHRRNGSTEDFAFARARSEAEKHFGREEFERYCALGHTLSPDQIAVLIASLRDIAPTDVAPATNVEAPLVEAPPPSQLSTLTAREWTIATRVAKGMSNGEIAEELFLSRRTVETHVATILRKADLHSRVKLAAVIGSMRLKG